MHDIKQITANLKTMIGGRLVAKERESRFGTWSEADERDLTTLQAALLMFEQPIDKTNRYVNKYDLIDWMGEMFPAGENAAVDFCTLKIEDHINDMPFLTEDGRKHEPYDGLFSEPTPPPEYDPFDRADFEHDDRLIEEEWNA